MMVRNTNNVTYKRNFLTVCDTFLTEEIAEKKDINYYIQVPANHKNSLNEFHTLLIDLSQSSEEIWNKIYHRTQTEISSFQNNNTFDHQVFHSLSFNKLEYYLKLLEKFTTIRKIRGPETERLHAYNKEGLLFISELNSGTESYCINFYRVTSQRAVNLHSFTTQELMPHTQSNSFFGRAHRTLHWKDLIYFKENGVPVYDLGGWYHGKDDEALLHINQFKEQFGGEKVKEYSGVIYNNPFVKLIKNILK